MIQMRQVLLNDVWIIIKSHTDCLFETIVPCTYTYGMLTDCYRQIRFKSIDHLYSLRPHIRTN